MRMIQSGRTARKVSRKIRDAGQRIIPLSSGTKVYEMLGTRARGSASKKPSRDNKTAIVTHKNRAAASHLDIDLAPEILASVPARSKACHSVVGSAIATTRASVDTHAGTAANTRKFMGRSLHRLAAAAEGCRS